MSELEERRKKTSALIRFFVIVLIVLIPIFLSELFLDRIPPVKEASPAPTTTAPPKLDTLSVGFKANIDRDAFLASFRRQARAELVPCLERWEFADRSLIFIGKLTKTGELSVRSTIPTGVMPPGCVGKSIAKMNFAPLTTSMKEKFLEVDWRIDW